MNLILIGRCFVLAFILAVLGTVFPIRLLDLAWQQGIIDTIVNAGSVPITGRVFMLVALLIKGYDPARLTTEPSLESLSVVPTSGILAKRKIARALRAVQFLAANTFRFVFVFGPSLFFALVAVLQIVVSAQTFRALDTVSLNQVTALTQQTTQARASLSATSEAAALDQAIRALVPAPEQQAVASLNPQQQRADLLKRLDEREASVRTELERQRTQRFTAIVWQTIKNVLLALLFGYCLFWLRPVAVRNALKGAS